jgi:hypothetical protein
MAAHGRNTNWNCLDHAIDSNLLWFPYVLSNKTHIGGGHVGDITSSC